MGRHGYIDDLGSDDPLAYGQWRGRVASAIRGKRGQKFLRETLAALDAMPTKRLVAEELQNGDEVCTLGACLVARGVAADSFDPYDHDGIGKELDISPCLVQEIEWLNDETAPLDPEKKWAFMRREIERLIRVEK